MRFTKRILSLIYNYNEYILKHIPQRIVWKKTHNSCIKTNIYCNVKHACVK